MPRQLIDMAGQRFGKLMVLALQPRAPGELGQARWICLCDCGKTSVVGGAHLRDGDTTSCGCWRDRPREDMVLDLAGQHFGHLTVVAMQPRKKSGLRWWRCRCVCGNEKAIRGDRLTRGETISCGCAVAGPFVISRPLKVREEAAAQHDQRLRPAFTRAEIYGLFEKQKHRCANCFDPITPETWHKDHIVPISRGGGAMIANIQLLCAPCNRRKYNKLPLDFAREQGRLL